MVSRSAARPVVGNHIMLRHHREAGAAAATAMPRDQALDVAGRVLDLSRGG
jgi:hypothetical protein